MLYVHFDMFLPEFMKRRRLNIAAVCPELILAAPVKLNILLPVEGVSMKRSLLSMRLLPADWHSDQGGEGEMTLRITACATIPATPGVSVI
jgi:hypothetical protein